jgi:hypothetical protein
MPEAQPVTRRDKRAMLIIGVFVLAVFAGVGIWAAVRPGSYGASRNGCITVNMPSTTGGALIHGCGHRARVMCRAAYAGHDAAARLTRPQCRLAGISPPPAGSAEPPAT